MATFGANPGENMFHDTFTNQNYNVNTSHPLIPNSQNYMYYKKYISIHSEDRDLLKYPNSSEFEIELPEDLTNVAAIKLIQWTFPANYNTFSISNSNVLMTFKISNPYNPAANGNTSEYLYRIYEALFINYDKNYEFIIEDGFYNPIQMATELTNKFNFTVSQVIKKYFILKGWTDSLNEFVSAGGYNRFIVVYNSVSQKLWFGNTTDPFILTNEVGLASNALAFNGCLAGRSHLPDFSNWGLPGYLGLSRCNTESINSTTLANIESYETYGNIVVPRFYYGDVTPGDNGYWLLPNLDLSGSQVNWVEAAYKINLMGEAFIYMEMAGQNCIDETQPFNVSEFTLTTNKTNGIVNAAFAKLPVPTTPLSQWFDRDAVPYKYYYPPAERMRRFKFRLRYHNGQLVNFGVFNYSFMLEFTLQVPQILRESKSIVFPPPMGR